MKRTVAAKPKLVQITTAYGKPAEGSAVEGNAGKKATPKSAPKPAKKVAA